MLYSTMSHTANYDNDFGETKMFSGFFPSDVFRQLFLCSLSVREFPDGQGCDLLLNGTAVAIQLSRITQTWSSEHKGGVGVYTASTGAVGFQGEEVFRCGEGKY